MRPKHKTHKRANPSSGLFNQTVQSKRWLYRALVSLHPLLFYILILCFPFHRHPLSSRS